MELNQNEPTNVAPGLRIYFERELNRIEPVDVAAVFKGDVTAVRRK